MDEGAGCRPGQAINQVHLRSANGREPQTPKPDPVRSHRGFAGGGAFRWRNAPVVGFARTGTVLDPTRPFRSTPSSNLDSFVEYARPFAALGRKVRWSAQLRAQNLLDDRTLLPWIAEDDGTGRPIVTQRLRPGQRQFVLSSTFGF